MREPVKTICIIYEQLSSMPNAVLLTTSMLKHVYLFQEQPSK